uniref:Pseudouridine-5'-phosphate glycosidase n=1 Tax=Bellilinea caldifistulae TaxID=360411 RepID=A0A7C4KZL4_9CHLR
MSINNFLEIANPIRKALFSGKPVVALESAVITHGLPYPYNQQLAFEMEDTIRQHNVEPATIAVLNGKIRVGLSPAEIERLAKMKHCRKISRRDFGIALSQGESGGTTVAGTLFAAHQAGIRVFATGGIGGVHRNAPFDVSADLHELSRTPLVVVCAGAKAILDLPATLEVLETLGVPVIGYQSEEFPAFYSRQSGLKVNLACLHASEIARVALAHWGAGIHSAVLVANPPPAEHALPAEEIETIIQQAVRQAEQMGIHGAAVTPYLLEKVNQLTGGASMQANLALLLNNGRLAADIAIAISEMSGASPRV